MKKLFYLLPLCTATAFAETVVYRPIAETNTTSLPNEKAEGFNATSVREGTWNAAGKEGTVTYAPTREITRGEYYALPINTLKIDPLHDSIYTEGDINWCWVNITYKMPELLTVAAGDVLKFSYTVTTPA